MWHNGLGTSEVDTGGANWGKMMLIDDSPAGAEKGVVLMGLESCHFRAVTLGVGGVLTTDPRSHKGKEPMAMH